MDVIYRYDPYQPIQIKSPIDAAAAMEELRKGNERFANYVRRMQERTLGAAAEEPLVIPVCPISLGLPLVAGDALTQSPFALFVGCSDARAPLEAIFDQWFNALFVVRVAGNVMGTECLGSAEYAVRNLRHSLRVAVVLGHTECGAITAAVESYLAPESYMDIAHTHALRSLIDRIQISVRGASHALEKVYGLHIESHANFAEALRNLTVYLNAATTAFDLRRALQAVDGSNLEVVYGVYDIANVRVKAYPCEPTPQVPEFAQAPTSPSEFIELGLHLANSPAIAALLSQ